MNAANVQQLGERWSWNQWGATFTEGDDWVILGKRKSIKILANNAAPLVCH
jgi:hypothetical protein